MLRAEVRKQLRDFLFEAELQVEARTTLVVVGENGAGKTTLLNLLAGLADPDSGHIDVDGRPWFDSTSAIRVPAYERDVGYVFQDYALFPHLGVLDNVAFGLRAKGIAAASAKATARRALERFGLGELAEARPAGLSGGQQQRVALARALVLEPRLLLLDEPLAALGLRAFANSRWAKQHEIL